MNKNNKKDLNFPLNITKTDNKCPVGEKIGKENLEKEKISVLFRRSEAEASGNAPIYSGFCSKKVQISSKRYRV